MSWRNSNEIAYESFLFFEATGDSELAIDSDISLENIQDSDDAESCSYDCDDHQLLDFQEENECDNDDFSDAQIMLLTSLIVVSTNGVAKCWCCRRLMKRK